MSHRTLRMFAAALALVTIIGFVPATAAMASTADQVTDGSDVSLLDLFMQWLREQLGDNSGAKLEGDGAPTP